MTLREERTSETSGLRRAVCARLGGALAIGSAFILASAPVALGEATERTPAHTPERTDAGSGDPGVATPAVPKLPSKAPEVERVGSKANQSDMFKLQKTNDELKRQKAVAPPRAPGPPGRDVPDASPPALREQGEVCFFNADCASGFCADGVCCNDPCSAACEACSVQRGGTQTGTCTPLIAGQGEPGCRASSDGGAR